MKFEPWLPVYGDPSYRDQCPAEDVEHINFVSWLRYNHPEIGLTLIHPKNEGKRSHQQTAKEKKMGLSKGASDIIIPGAPTFVCELKRLDHTKSTWQAGQKEFLAQCHKQGAFVCVALGAAGAKLAFIAYIKTLGRL